MTAPAFGTTDLGGVRLALDWARDEGWNPGLDDAPAFFAGDREGFFMATVGDAPAAVISVVNHSSDLAFLGLYIAHPEQRGRGIGYALWQHALGHAGSRVVGLDGVPDQQDNYRRSGFELAGETHRFSGYLEGRTSTDVSAGTEQDVPHLTVMEARACGYEKPAFSDIWYRDTDTRRTRGRNREGITGFVTIRACGHGYKIGPVVADSVADAEVLIRAAVAAVGADEVIIDVPDDCPELMAFCEGEGLRVSFNTARMYRGPAPTPGPGQRAVATLELG